jgi:EAL domain-containing protein (putative c-di-GMP-specific phosphodiesterase class I)/ActR/RegA family two-component response regulator
VINKTDLMLLVDDDVFATKVMAAQLRKLGFENTKSINDPLLALEFLRSNKDEIKAIVCDLQMPALDGIEFIREVSLEKFVGALLLVSGEDPRVLRSAQRLVDAMGLKLLGAIQKPVELEALAKIMANAVVLKHAGQHAPQFSVENIQAGLEAREFVNFYQPKVDVKTGEVIGVEALIRWQHPQFGVISPGGFLAEMEANGLDHELLIQVLTSTTGALALLREHAKRDEQFKVSVNLSDANLRDPQLPEKLVELVKQYGVNPRNLVLEVSENRMAGGRTLLITTLSRLALKGFSLSLDDFGAGKTTMSDLSDIAITELKFDRSFVHNVHLDSAQELSLSSCIKMAEALGMRTVAEGIEEVADWHTIRNLGCNVVQGYLVAKPMPLDSLAGWIKAWDDHLSESALFVQYGPSYRQAATSTEATEL